MRASVTSLAGIGLAAWLGGCAVGSFDLGRGTSTASTPAPAPVAEPAPVTSPGGYTPPQAHTSQVPAPRGSSQDAPGAAPAAADQTPAYQSQGAATPQLPAGRATRAPTPPPPEAEPDPDVMTTQRAREQCWMASESTKFARNLDQKVKYVEKCVNDKMRAAGQ